MSEYFRKYIEENNTHIMAKEISNTINAAVRNREVIICDAEGLKELA